MKSHINEAKFTKRIPTDDYAFEEYSLSAIVDPKEDGEDVLIEMRRQVSNAFAADLVAETEKKTKASKPTKAVSAAAEEEDEETPAEEEEVRDYETDDADDSDEEAADVEEEERDYEEDSNDEEEEEEKPQKTAKPDKKEAKKSFRKKPQTYNRSIDQHREIFSRALKAIKPDWKSSDTLKARVKKISETMEGKNFLDENGEVLADFKAEVKKRLLAKAKAK